MKKNLQNKLNSTSSNVSILCIVLLAASSHPLMSMRGRGQVEGPKVERNNEVNAGSESKTNQAKPSIAERASNGLQSASKAVSAAVGTAATTLGFNKAKAPEPVEPVKEQKSGLQLASDALVNTGKVIASAVRDTGTALYHAPGYAVEAFGGQRQFITGETGSLSFAAKTAYNALTGKPIEGSSTNTKSLDLSGVDHENLAPKFSIPENSLKTNAPLSNYEQLRQVTTKIIELTKKRTQNGGLSPQDQRQLDSLKVQQTDLRQK